MSEWVLPRDQFDRFLERLKQGDRTLIGPTARDGAIVYDEISAASDLPEGVGDEQAPGRYRLVEREDAALFGYAVGPHSWKRYLFPPEVRQWTASRGADGSFSVEPEQVPDEPKAFVGVRPCELEAIRIQDTVFLEGPYPDPSYEARRADPLLVAVNCGSPAGTCFCVSMNTGPKAMGGYDLCLTEVLEGEGHWFFLETRTERGAAVAADLGLSEATAAERAAAVRVTDDAAKHMGRELETDGLREALAANPDHPRWDDVASRCMTCANCTLACPTCFCSDVEDTTDLTGDHTERWRRWGSCFTSEHSYMHGGSARSSAKSQYRQWLTHKLSTWHDQFDTSGCVGCGRCITWCPTGIDMTEEAAAILASSTKEDVTRADDH